MAAAEEGRSGNGIMIRDLAQRDWPAVRSIFDAVVSRGDSFVYDTDMTDRAARSLWIQAPPGRTVVALDERGAILGTAKMGPNQRGPGAHVATASFMVAEDARRRGVGRRLAEDALAWASIAGFRAVQFNAVVATNEPALELWRSLRFRVIGKVPGGFRLRNGDFVDLLILHRHIS